MPNDHKKSSMSAGRPISLSFPPVNTSELLASRRSRNDWDIKQVRAVRDARRLTVKSPNVFMTLSLSVFRVRVDSQTAVNNVYHFYSPFIYR